MFALVIGSVLSTRLLFLAEGAVVFFAVAVLLLPIVSVLLLVMDRIEDRMLGSAPVERRHAGRRRHLRLIPGGRRGSSAETLPAVAGTGGALPEAGRRAA
ncbi:hypothetical protein [Streptomyces tropicalis]|uniref:Uncharacterized protein n=1 Tax=Streptomyces tropicalis TaxID=3034234 RepID=A0ABT6AE09_9ACTN|nr:hypothetical protein [Streptomyces tropicalis]MDF3302894.1 hypothetical protein [Streptomyces tropicalis]